MAKKSNIRSIRFSDELAELIDQQIGDTFTAKFEHLIIKCVWELPTNERKLDDLCEQIHEKRAQLGRMSSKVDAYRYMLQDLDKNLQDLSINIARAQELYWEDQKETPTQWISVKNKVPEQPGPYIVHYQRDGKYQHDAEWKWRTNIKEFNGYYTEVCQRWWDGKNWTGYGETVTHWAPLPPAP